MKRLDRVTCEEAFRRLNDYVDRALDPEEMRLVREHLATCEVCAREFKFEASLIEELRAKLRRIDVPPELVAKISARLARAEQDAASDGAGERG